MDAIYTQGRDGGEIQARPQKKYTPHLLTCRKFPVFVFGIRVPHEILGLHNKGWERCQMYQKINSPKC